MRLSPRAIVATLVLCLLTGHPGLALAQQPLDGVAVIAAENDELASRIAAEEAGLAQERAELARVQATREQLEGRMQRIARHAELQAVGREFAVMVRSALRALPRPEQFAAAKDGREVALEAASDAGVRAEVAALGLADLDAAVGRRLSAMPRQPPTIADRDATRARLVEQRNLLERRHSLAHERLKTLRDIDHAEAALLERVVTARIELTRLLFWLPSPPERRLLTDLELAIGWAVSGTHWRDAAESLVAQALRFAMQSALAVLVATILILARSRLRRGLAALAAHAASDLRSRLGDALKAILVTLALALPVPLLLWTAGGLLAAAVVAPPFTLALGEALTAASRLLLALSGCIWLLAPGGLAVGHFGWGEAATHHAWRSLRRFTAVFVPVMFVAALNGLDHAPYANRETLSRLAFAAAMVLLIVLIVRLFRRASPLIQKLAQADPGGWAMRLYPAWYAALPALPLALLALTVAGYLTAAAFFYSRVVVSFFLLIAAGMMYGLVALWVQTRHRALERTGTAPGEAPAGSTVEDRSGGELATVAPQRVDLASLSEQTRSLLDLALTVLLLAGLWSIWRDAVPALSTIGEIALWSSAAVGGQPASRLTVTELFLALVIATVTWVAVRNIGALLDTVLLHRLEFQADANYAIKVISRYAITALGVVLASDTLGIAWSNVQWLVAALGVGLGFGLQEIVANFVSGLIVLAERPVRIGDVVTIGGVTGTVSRIRARATVVVDSDSREVIVPNKGFITERVVNWTLSDTTTRLLLTFGVAHGSDVEMVRREVLAAVKATADVMPEPSPSVFLVGLGEKSLNFEVRAFVRSLGEVMRVRHGLNAAIERTLRENAIVLPAVAPDPPAP